MSPTRPRKIREAICSRLRSRFQLGVLSGDGSREQCLREASEICMAGGAAALIGSVLIWARGGSSGLADKAGAERLGIFVGLWVPSLMLLSAHLARKADDAASAARDEEPFPEELM